MGSRRGPTTFRRLLSASLAAGLIGLGVPLPAAAEGAPVVSSASEVYAEVGGQVYLVDLSEAHRGHAALHGGSGSFSVSVHVPPGESRPVGPVPDVPEVRWLGTSFEQAETGTGRRDLAPWGRWEERFRWSVDASPAEIRSSYVVGDDRLVLTVPRSAADGEPLPGDAVEIEVNGWSARIDPVDFYRAQRGLQKGKIPGAEEIPESLRDLPGKFRDPAGFFSAATTASLIFQKTEDDAATPNSCIGPCLGCAAAILGWGVSIAHLIASCGSVMISGGTTAVMCLWGLAAHEVANIMVVAKCVDCAECRQKPGKPICPAPCPSVPD